MSYACAEVWHKICVHSLPLYDAVLHEHTLSALNAAAYKITSGKSAVQLMQTLLHDYSISLGWSACHR